MSRSDGSFPSYNKYKIDSERWPSGYWDKSYRCSNCAMHWPVDPHFAISPCCGAKTGRADSPPDMRWPEAVTALLESRFEKFYDEWNEDKTDAELSFEETLHEIEQIEALTDESSRTVNS